MMEERYEFLYFPDRWITWRASLRANSAFNQLDGFLLLDDAKVCILYECKVRNTQEAIWQMIHYARLLKLLLPGWLIRTVEVCKYYDPVIRAPDETEPLFLREPDELPAETRGRHSVLLFG